MLRYIQHYIRSVWYRWFKTKDEHDEMLIIYSSNAYCKAAMHNGHYSSSYELNKVVKSFYSLKSYIWQMTEEQGKKINYYTIAEDMQARYGPDVPSIKLRMHHFLLMCLDDV